MRRWPCQVDCDCVAALPCHTPAAAELPLPWAFQVDAEEPVAPLPFEHGPHESCDCRHRTPWPGADLVPVPLLLRHIGLVLLLANGLTAAPDRLLTRLPGVAAPVGDEPLLWLTSWDWSAALLCPTSATALFPLPWAFQVDAEEPPSPPLPFEHGPHESCDLPPPNALAGERFSFPFPCSCVTSASVLLLRRRTDRRRRRSARRSGSEHRSSRPSPDATDCVCATSCDWSAEFA